MPVCQFFLQGRCRYGEKCWNEHPGGGGGGGGRGGGGGGYSNNRAPPPQQQPRGGGGGGGFGNRVWVNPSQQRGGYVQPSSFGSRENDQWNRRGNDGGGGSDWGRGGGGGGGGSDWGRGGGGGGGSDWGRGGGGGGGGGSDWGRGGGGGGGGGSDWGRGGGGGGGGSDWGRSGGGGGGGFGRRENIKSSDFNFSQNRFSALDTPSTFDKGGRAATTTGDDDNDRKCETIQSDMDAWENSGQWCLSTYSHAKNPLSGFSDLAPEELRLEYYTSRASGNLQNYINGVNQLLNQWRSRVQELKLMNASTRAALIRELSSSAPQDFGSTDTGSAFGSKGFGTSDQLSSYSFAGQTSGFASSSVSTSNDFGSAPSAPPSGFGGAPSAAPPSGFGGAPSAAPPSGFGATPAPSASAFSFAASDKTSTVAPSGFGSASGFSFSAGTGGGLGTGFGAQTPVTTGVTSVFGQPSTSVPAPAVPVGGASDSLFSSESNLTSEELDQFKAKRFTLGQIPLKPPPANLLSV